MILVTGGTGLVGSHVLLKLCESNTKFKALKRINSNLKICKEVFAQYKSIELFNKIQWVNGDLIDIPSLETAINGCTKIIHCAGMISYNVEDFNILQKINVEGTKNLMNLSISYNIKKISYISSTSTIGNNIYKKELDESCQFKYSKKQSGYAISKFLAEQEVWRASQEGVPVVILNPSVILGPGEWNKGSSQIFKKIYTGLKFYTLGSTGYVDVIDVANCAIKLLNSKVKNERFIINSENMKFKKLFDLIAEKLSVRKPHLKVNPLIKEIAWRYEYIKSIILGNSPLITRESANISMKNTSYSNIKIKQTLDYKFIPIKESINKYCEWFLRSL